MNRRVENCVAIVPCGECHAKKGEFCKSDTGRVWKSETHFVRRAAARAERIRIRRERGGKERLYEFTVDASQYFLLLTESEALVITHAIPHGAARLDMSLEMITQRRVNARKLALMIEKSALRVLGDEDADILEVIA